MKKIIINLLILLIPVVTSPAVLAEEDVMDDVMKSVEDGFTEMERRMIKRYYHERHGGNVDEDDSDHDRKHNNHKKDKSKKGLPPGLAKRDSLPPGLQKHLDKNGALPPGLAKRDLPEDLERQLGKPRHGYERTIVDNDVVLIEAATRKVVDVITDAVLGD